MRSILGVLVDMVSPARHAAVGRAVDEVVHVAHVLELIEQVVNRIPAEPTAPAQVVDTHVPVIGLREDRQQEAACRERQSVVIDECLVDYEITPPARRANDRLSHWARQRR
jgi:hypothetical protein